MPVEVATPQNIQHRPTGRNPVLFWRPRQTLQLTCRATACCQAKSEATVLFCGQKLSAASIAAHLTLQLTSGTLQSSCNSAPGSSRCARSSSPLLAGSAVLQLTRSQRQCKPHS